MTTTGTITAPAIDVDALIEAAAAAFYDHTHKGSRNIAGEPITWADEVDAPYGKGSYRALMRPVVEAIIDAQGVTHA
jgi:hypothetical protein